MSNHDSPNGDLPGTDDILTSVSGLPAQLTGDSRRQAVPSIRGTVYQAWCSIDAWLRLKDAEEVIYLEGAEDFDISRTGDAIAVQVKDNTGTISLGTEKARTALDNFWELSCQEAGRPVNFHYLTTSSVAMERGASFGGLKGIDAWRAARTNLGLAKKMAEYLVSKLDSSSALRTFLDNSTPEIVQERLIQRFYWLTNQPDLETVKRSVNDRITVLLDKKSRSISLTSNVLKYLESRFWEIIVKQPSTQRCLTYAELLRQLEAATIIPVPFTLEQISKQIGGANPGLDLLNLLRIRTPRPPEPLLQRSELTMRLEELLNLRKFVLLTGTVYKGKTTMAQLVCSTLCPDAWWINLTERNAKETDNIFHVLAKEFEKEDCPRLIVIDDLDTSPVAHRVYQDSLSLVLHRANSLDKNILLTAQGSSSNLAIEQDFKNIDFFEVPELDADEVKVLLLDHGCPEETAKVWGPVISVQTYGHPKLVQVRLEELADQGWPDLSVSDLAGQSPGSSSVRQRARELLASTQTDPVSKLVYMISLSSILVHRSVAIRLVEKIDNSLNGGDIIDKLTGKWLEQIDGEWFRTTALLKGATSDVWSSEELKQAHIYLHDSIAAKGTLDQFEAAALLFHAYIGGEPRRMAHTALKLQRIDNSDTQHEVERQLLWLPFVALEPGQTITDDAMVDTILRNLQFRVASRLDTDCLPQICDRWADDIKRIPNPEAIPAYRSIMWLSTGFSESPKVPLKHRLDAIVGIPTLPSEILNTTIGLGKKFFETTGVNEGLPQSGTTAQSIFLCATLSVSNLSNLDELLQWLDNEATEDIRQQFDEMLEWPLVQTLGAFVQRAWVAVHEETEDWEPWIALFEQVDEYARRRASPRFGREAAKAKAIILNEYLDQGKEALEMLDLAEEAFGKSAVLMEARTNVLFHAQDDKSVLGTFYQFANNQKGKTFIDPFVYRRAGISATRLQRWDEAAKIFHEGAELIPIGFLDVTKFGLYVDTAFATSHAGNQVEAAKILTAAILALPTEASKEGDRKWDMVQRIASETRKFIEKRIWKSLEVSVSPHLEPGQASSPILQMPNAEPEQARRSIFTKVQVLKLATILGVNPPGLKQELDGLGNSHYIMVRHLVSQAKLALAYSTGANTDFIEALLAFDTSMADISVKTAKGLSLVDPDEGPESDLSISPEQWFGLLCAGAICAGSDLITKMSSWLDASIRLLGEEATLTNNIRLLIKGASQPIESLEPNIFDTSNPPTLCCGAAARLLLENLPAYKTLGIQVFLTSGLVSVQNNTVQELYNLHVARTFAIPWHEHAKNSFQFNAPRITIPALLSTLDGIKNGSSTLKDLLLTTASATELNIGDLPDRVL